MQLTWKHKIEKNYFCTFCIKYFMQLIATYIYMYIKAITLLSRAIISISLLAPCPSSSTTPTK